MPKLNPKEPNEEGDSWFWRISAITLVSVLIVFFLVTVFSETTLMSHIKKFAIATISMMSVCGVILLRKKLKCKDKKTE